MQDLTAASRPACPVAQLALPALTMRAVTLPPVAVRCLRPMVMGAATTWLRGEHGGGGGSAGADGEGDVGLAAGFDAGGDGGPVEAEGERW